VRKVKRNSTQCLPELPNCPTRTPSDHASLALPECCGVTNSAFPKVLVEPKRIICDLIPNSAAERAGLRNGDEITQPVPQDRIQGDQHALLTLKLLRDGQPLEITYLPRGKEVEAFQ
jgi:hypothetical protein